MIITCARGPIVVLHV